MDFKNIFEEYKDLVYNLCVHYTHCVEDAEEVSQDVFVTVFQKLNSFQGNSSLKTWIYRLTINHCLDFLKAKSAKKRWFVFSKNRSGDGGVLSSMSLPNHPGNVLEEKESYDQLLNLISRLPENQKSVVILECIEGLSREEIAQILNCSTKAVESLMGRARKKLKLLMDQSKENEK